MGETTDLEASESAARRWVGHATERVMARRADDVFVALCDIRGMAAWHEGVDSVLGAPTAMSAGRSWITSGPAGGPSGENRRSNRSTLILHDLSTRRFAYTSTAVGGDGTYVDWRWHVSGAGAQCTVRVGFVLRAASRWRGGSSEASWRRRISVGIDRSLERLELVTVVPVATAEAPVGAAALRAVG